MKKGLVVLGIFLVFLAVALGSMFFTLRATMQEIVDMPIYELDLEKLDDGMYEGEFYYEDQFGATVSVIVENHQIIDITIIEHISGLGEKAETITSDIVLSQSVQVDAISGATLSSHVIQLAIQNALEIKE